VSEYAIAWIAPTFVDQYTQNFGTLPCKTNALTILKHQMRISTTQVFSVMLRSKNLEIRKRKVKTERVVGWKPKCHEIEPNPSKDRAIPEGDSPSFWDEFTKFTFSSTVQFIFVF
jgi:hypothetical protein